MKNHCNSYWQRVDQKVYPCGDSYYSPVDSGNCIDFSSHLGWEQSNGKNIQDHKIQKSLCEIEDTSIFKTVEITQKHCYCWPQKQICQANQSDVSGMNAKILVMRLTAKPTKTVNYVSDMILQDAQRTLFLNRFFYNPQFKKVEN